MTLPHYDAKDATKTFEYVYSIVNSDQEAWHIVYWLFDHGYIQMGDIPSAQLIQLASENWYRK